VRNAGEVRVPNATLTVTWPYALKEVPEGDPGPHVLYLMHEPVLVGLVYCDSHDLCTKLPENFTEIFLRFCPVIDLCMSFL